jgi:hypothetical protein
MKEDIITTRKNKKTANYGIAANQVLHPMGNDITNIIYFLLITKYLTKVKSNLFLLDVDNVNIL